MRSNITDYAISKLVIQPSVGLWETFFSATCLWLLNTISLGESRIPRLPTQAINPILVPVLYTRIIRMFIMICSSSLRADHSHVGVKQIYVYACGAFLRTFTLNLSCHNLWTPTLTSKDGEREGAHHLKWSLTWFIHEKFHKETASNSLVNYIRSPEYATIPLTLD